MDLSEQYSEFYSTFVVISPPYHWQKEILEEWCCTSSRFKKQADCYIAEELSEAEEEALKKLLIPFERVIMAIDVD